MSCWTQAVEMATSPMWSSGVSVPATPELTISVTPNLRIMVWAQRAAKTLPTPLRARTTRLPSRLPMMKSMPETVSVRAFFIMLRRIATSTSIAPMMPVICMCLSPLDKEQLEALFTMARRLQR